MTSTSFVKAHPRKKPGKSPEYISKHEQLRAELAAQARGNSFRDRIGYQQASLLDRMKNVAVWIYWDRWR